MVKFNKYEYKDWQKFRMGKNDVITAAEFEMVAKLHSVKFNHSYFKPCTCSPQTINKWIKDLNIIWDNGNQED